MRLRMENESLGRAGEFTRERSHATDGPRRKVFPVSFSRDDSSYATEARDPGDVIPVDKADAACGVCACVTIKTVTPFLARAANRAITKAASLSPLDTEILPTVAGAAVIQMLARLVFMLLESPGYSPVVSRKEIVGNATSWRGDPRNSIRLVDY